MEAKFFVYHESVSESKAKAKGCILHSSFQSLFILSSRSQGLRAHSVLLPKRNWNMYKWNMYHLMFIRPIFLLYFSWLWLWLQNLRKSRKRLVGIPSIFLLAGFCLCYFSFSHSRSLYLSSSLNSLRTNSPACCVFAVNLQSLPSSLCFACNYKNSCCKFQQGIVPIYKFNMSIRMGAGKDNPIRI